MCSMTESMTLEYSQSKQGEPINVHSLQPLRKNGTLFLEARLRDGFFESGGLVPDGYAKLLESQLVKNDGTFDMLEDILANEGNAISRLGYEYEQAKDMLQCLKVVEYVGPATLETCFSSFAVELKVNIFQVYTNAHGENLKNADGLLGEVLSMPHARFEGIWDELIFHHELKADLIWMMTNILRFSRAFTAHKIQRKLNPLILLHGPPGSGKSSLCLGLAQKISIRLSGTYKSTRLIQIKTAALLSKYFSESAKHVDDIFSRISAMCESDPEGFICVLIDEVESIASSREYSTKEGESHDSLRATNALLTGLDRTARYPNVVFLFTSNLYDALEPAFLDRCGLTEFVGPPSIAGQYEILRSGLVKLILCEVIQPAADLPTYDDALVQTQLSMDLPGSKLLDIVRRIHSSTKGQKARISGRSLGQLPEKGLMRYLRGEECDLATALSFCKRCVDDTVKGVTEVFGDSIEVAKAKALEAEARKSDLSDTLKELDQISTEILAVQYETIQSEEEKYNPTPAMDSLDESGNGLLENEDCEMVAKDDSNPVMETLDELDTSPLGGEDFQMVERNSSPSNANVQRPDQKKRTFVQSLEWNEGAKGMGHKRTKM
ncbi:hypothetical protein VTL71DRAFT_12075 [Oculimacula yallundae]|uniref:AAA+ ATPase domain-containing protein n=1 Tax=Oculimacula yallundae TaxID=86028 RepID=A0ABR4CSG9_9HELO